jgi:hypothetical protein
MLPDTRNGTVASAACAFTVGRLQAADALKQWMSVARIASLPRVRSECWVMK